MNLILLFQEDFIQKDRVRLTDYRADHIRHILKPEKGQALSVGIADTGLGQGIVVDITSHHVDLEILPVKTTDKLASRSLPISVIMALPRPQTLKKVLEIGAGFGVQKISFISTQKVQKSFFDSKLVKDHLWFHHIRLGMEQGRQVHVPEITFHPSFHRFLKNTLPLFSSFRILLDENAEKTLWKIPVKIFRSQEISTAIGPEGGWTPEEIEIFRKNDFSPVSLGTPTLRVENATCAFLSQVALMQSHESS